jgi:hypothetical protein
VAEVAICSLVRDGMAYLPSYRRQLESLSVEGGHGWRLYVIEGDSRDASYAFLQRWAEEDSRVRVGQQHVGDGVGVEERAARWARAGNACLDLVPAGGAHTHVLWLESDLCFPADLLVRLLAHRVDVVAPIIWIGGLFYDTWGFRGMDGVKWQAETRFRTMQLVEMNSVGSCVLFDRKVLDAGILFRPAFEDGLLVGMCNDARARGMKVWADTGTAILHPVSVWEAQMWRCSGVALSDGRGMSEQLSPAEANMLGLDPNMPNLDAGFLLRGHRAFLCALFRRLDTNRLEVEVTARAYPRRSYAMRVRRQAPLGFWRLGLVRRLLFRLSCDLYLSGDDQHRASLRTRWFRPGPLRCDFRIIMEEAR